LPLQGQAQSVTNRAVLKGLAPVSALANSPVGRAALAANHAVTGGIQAGAIRQPTLLPFEEQQQQALRDAFIAAGNLAQLDDGLGTTLGAAYRARAHYVERGRFTSLSRGVADVIAYANATTRSDSSVGKYFFANGTLDGRTPVSAEAVAIFKSIGGAPDMFGRYSGARQGASGPAPSATRGPSKPSRTSPTSWDATISTCRSTTSSTTAARS
jgi:hypothetical protein